MVTARDSGRTMRVATGLFCEKAYRTTDGKVVAAGIFPGSVAVPKGHATVLEAVVLVDQDHDRPFKWQLRVVSGGVVTFQERMESTVGASQSVATCRIPVGWDAGVVEVVVRERHGEWISAAKIAVVATEEISPPVAQGPVS